MPWGLESWHDASIFRRADPPGTQSTGLIGGQVSQETQGCGLFKGLFFLFVLGLGSFGLAMGPFIKPL